MMWTRRSVGVLLAVALCVILGSVVSAKAQTIEWAAATTFTDGSQMTAAEQGAMKFYIRARKQGDVSARKYFGETANGVATWAGDFATRFIANGLAAPVAGEMWEVTVSQAFKNPSGVELDSAESAVALYTFPFGPDRTPGTAGTPVVTE